MAKSKKKIVSNIIDIINLIIVVYIILNQFTDIPEYVKIIFVTTGTIGLILRLSQWKDNSTVDNITSVVAAIFIVGILLFAMLGII